MATKFVKMRLDEDLLSAIDGVAPDRGRTEWVQEACRQRLAQGDDAEVLVLHQGGKANEPPAEPREVLSPTQFRAKTREAVSATCDIATEWATGGRPGLKVLDVQRAVGMAKELAELVVTYEALDPADEVPESVEERLEQLTDIVERVRGLSA